MNLFYARVGAQALVLSILHNNINYYKKKLKKTINKRTKQSKCIEISCWLKRPEKFNTLTEIRAHNSLKNFFLHNYPEFAKILSNNKLCFVALASVGKWDFTK